MADKTTNYKLVKPGFAEFNNAWWEPLNDNFDDIDALIFAVTSEVAAARGAEDNLLDFLTVGHNPDGTLKAVPEVISARNSPIFGNRDPNSLALLPLKSRLDSLEYEIFAARVGQTALIDGLSLDQTGLKDMVLTGTKDGNGFPTWLTNAAATATVRGDLGALFLLIGGYMSRIRTSRDIVVSGAAGTYVLYAARQVSGVVTVDGDSTVAPPAAPHGSISADINTDQNLFTDSTTDFTTKDVKAGDKLVLVDSASAGTYVVKTVAPGGNVNQLQIIGVFPVGSLSSINYNVVDPMAVTTGFVALASATPVAGRLYIGEADFDGTAITAVRPRHFRDIYVGNWQAFDVTSTAIVEKTWLHRLGGDVLDVSVQVSQANDGSLPVEELALADLKNNLGVGLGSLVVDLVNLKVDKSNFSFTPTTVQPQGSETGVNLVVNSDVALKYESGSSGLSGTPAVTGTVTPTRSAAAKWDRNTVSVKNVASNLYYKDYGGIERQTGFVRVVIRKRA